MNGSLSSDAADDFSIAVEPNGSHVLLRVSGELDMLTARQLSEMLETHDGSPSSLVIDLSQLTFIDSGGIHALVRACRLTPTRVVCPQGHHVRRVLDLVSFNRVTPVHESLEAALSP